MSVDRLPCPIDGCPDTRAPEHAFCPRHWKAVPMDLRKEVISAYTARRRAARALRGVDASDPDLQRRRRAAFAATTRDHLQALEDAEAAVENRTPIDLFVGA